MNRSLTLSRRHRRWILCAGAAAGAFLIYHHPAVAARRRRIARLASALSSLADAVAAVASDLATFLLSDSDSLPATLTQLSKLASSHEATASASALSGALTAGVLRGYASASASSPASGGEAAFSDRLVEKLFSPAGERLVSAVAGSFGRDIVLACYSIPADPSGSSAASWVDVVTGGSCRSAICSWVEVFTATAVGVFIDKTIHINTYDQICAAATNPAYDSRLQNLLVALCTASVETSVKTYYHSVLSDGNGNANANDSAGNGGVGDEGWAETVSSALAVPSNRKLVLDLTGRATFEAVRSFLEFVLWRLHDAARAGGDATARAGLRVLNRTWLLAPA